MLPLVVENIKPRSFGSMDAGVSGPTIVARAQKVTHFSTSHLRSISVKSLSSSWAMVEDCVNDNSYNIISSILFLSNKITGTIIVRAVCAPRWMFLTHYRFLVVAG